MTQLLTKTLLLFTFLLFAFITNAQISDRLQDEINNHKQDRYRIRIEFYDNVDCFGYNNEFKIKKYSLEKRQKTIIRLLQEQANTSQQPLVSHLQKNYRKEYDNLQQFWIINIVVLEASEDLIFALEDFASIALIDLEDNTYLPSLPVEEGNNSVEKAAGGAEPGLVAINAPAMWALGYTGRGRVVYDYDTGVWPEHPAFKDRFMANFYPVSQSWLGFFNNEPNGSVNDHGTHTLGTIAGLDTATNDTIGVAFKSYWIANDFVTSTVAALPPLTDMISAFEWALNPDGDTATTHDIPDVISNSWRWYDEPDTVHCGGFIVNLMNSIEAVGIANVFAGGNFGPSNTTVSSPQRINTSEVNTFTVGSIDANQLFPYPISSFSSRGPTQCGGIGSLLIHPEVVAPGQNVRSAWGSSDYNTISGTSMATPHVSGAILLLKEAFPYLTGEELLWALYLTAIDMGDPGEDNTYGNGLIDVYAAFQYLSATYTPVDPNAIDWDLAIQEVNLPGITNLSCTNTYTPEVTLTNLGDSTITQVSLAYYFESTFQHIHVWNGSLQSGGTTSFTLPSIISNTFGEQELTVIASTAKDSLEYDLYNNRKITRFNRRGSYSLPFTENFENGINAETWLVSNDDMSTTWDTISTSGLDWSSYSASIQHYNYSPRNNQLDELISPEITLPGTGITSLSFDIAYRKRSNSGFLMDTLKVFVSNDCGDTFPFQVYEKFGDSLFTNDTLGTDFHPAYSTDWRRETIDLSSFNGSNILFKIQGVNRQGNNLYLDNINLYQGQDFTAINNLNSIEFNIFPNPADEQINLVLSKTLGENVEIIVYDVLGKVIYTNAVSGSTSISVANWRSGLYAISVKKGEYLSSKRFVVK